MKKLLSFLLSLSLVVFSTPAFSQTSKTGQVMTGTFATRPVNCNPSDIYDTTDTFTIYLCGPVNTWTAIGVNTPGLSPFIGPAPWYDVTNTAYGAVGDGTTDDTVAIQTAINAQVNASTGGTIYFPCGKTFKFGVLDLSQHAQIGSNQSWTILNFCGTPKPTATLTVYGHHAIIGTGGDSQNFPFGNVVPYTGFDTSAFPSDGSPVIFVPNGENSLYFDHIGINISGSASADDAIKLGTDITVGPTQVTITNSVLGPTNNGTGACLESSVGFYLVLDTVSCTGSQTTPRTGLVIHGTGIIRMNNIVLGRRGISLLGPALTGIIGTNVFQGIYTENLIDPGLFEINTANFPVEALKIGPSIEIADNAGGGQYLLNHTGDTSEVKVQIDLGAVRGWQTQLFNGPNFVYSIVGESSSPVNTVGGIGASLLNGVITGNSDQNSFGPCGFDPTNVSLTACQFQVSSPALKIFDAAGTSQGDIFGLYTGAGATVPLITFFDKLGASSDWGINFWDGSGHTVSLITPFHTFSGNSVVTIPDSTSFTFAGLQLSQTWSGTNTCASCSWVNSVFSGSTQFQSGYKIPLSTKTTTYLLTANDYWVNVTGTTTITVPHALTGQLWTVFNSGSNTVTIQADTGNINGTSSVTLSANTGFSITCDGTNCMAH